MIIRRTIEGKEVKIELTSDELIAAREETEKQFIRYKLKILFDKGLVSKEALHDEDLINDLLEDMHMNIDLNNMSESDAIDAAIERLILLGNEQEEE